MLAFVLVLTLTLTLTLTVLSLGAALLFPTGRLSSHIQGQGAQGPPVLVSVAVGAAGPHGAAGSTLPTPTPSLPSWSLHPSGSAVQGGSVYSCTTDQGLPLSLTGTFNTTSPPTGTPQPCTLSSNLSVSAPTGSLVVWGNDPITVADPYSNHSLWMDIAGGLTIGGGATFSVAQGTALRLAVEGTVTVLPGANLTLSSNSTLLLGAGSHLIVDGGRVYTHGTPIHAGGGSVLVTYPGILDGSSTGPTATLGLPRVSNINVTGTLGTFADSDSDLHWFDASAPGNVGTVSLQGFFSRPLQVQNLTVNSTGSFFADDAALSGIALTSSTSVQLGVEGPAADTVSANGFTVGNPVGSLIVAHAQVSGLGVSANRVLVENSSLGPGASSVAASTTGSFVANGSSHFGFPIVFNSVHWANLTNTTAPSITVAGNAQVNVYNWGFNTTLGSSTSGVLSSITTGSTAVAVHVWRYLLVSASPVSSAVRSTSIQVSVCGSGTNGSSSSGNNCATLRVDAQGEVGEFVPTDVVTLDGIDTFVGTYQVSATSQGTGYSSDPVTVQVTHDDLLVRVVMSPPVVPAQLVPVLLLEVGGIGVVVGTIAFLRTRIRLFEHRRSDPQSPSHESKEGSASAPSEKVSKASQASSGPEKGKAPPERGDEGAAGGSGSSRRPPAKEWRPPRA